MLQLDVWHWSCAAITRVLGLVVNQVGSVLERALWTPTGSPGPLEATTPMTTGDHLFGEVIIEDTDAAATRTANEWQGTAIWTDGSRPEDGSVYLFIIY